jgi:hypothetical protein
MITAAANIDRMTAAAIEPGGSLMLCVVSGWDRVGADVGAGGEVVMSATALVYPLPVSRVVRVEREVAIFDNTMSVFVLALITTYKICTPSVNKFRRKLGRLVVIFITPLIAIALLSIDSAADTYPMNKLWKTSVDASAKVTPLTDCN